MTRIVYLDEVGDHSLEIDDPAFPVFVLVMVVADVDAYNDRIIPMVNRFKIDFFGHESVVLHSRDIRKQQNQFGFLTDRTQREAVYERINEIMASPGYSLIASVIRKQVHKKLYGVAAMNPYDLALTFALERLLPLLEEESQEKVYLVAEARGRREDEDLHRIFANVVTHGTKFNPGRRFRKIAFHLMFKPKAMNCVGTQLADLAAYPIARYVIDPHVPNPAYAVIQGKFYVGRGGIKGLKVFPKN